MEDVFPIIESLFDQQFSRAYFIGIARDDERKTNMKWAGFRGCFYRDRAISDRSLLRFKSDSLAETVYSFLTNRLVIAAEPSML